MERRRAVQLALPWVDVQPNLLQVRAETVEEPLHCLHRAADKPVVQIPQLGQKIGVGCGWSYRFMETQ